MKRIAALMLVLVLAMASLAGCGGNQQGGGEGSKAEEVKKPELKDYGSGEIKIWVANEVLDFTKQKAEEFIAAHEAYKGYTIAVEEVGEGDAAGKMITDVDAGADIFGFAQDQLARLVSTGAVSPALWDAAWITEQNDALSVGAATMGGTIYAYPVTSDNGYFLYYDKSVITDPSSLDKILEQCEKAGKSFYMEINSGWYQTAFFFAAGCKMDFTANDEGGFTAADMTYASEGGVNALKAMIKLAESPAFVNGSSVSAAANAAAVVSGTWDSGAAKELFGDNYAAVKLPTANIGGKDVQLSGFGGFKLMGVKPQTEEGKLVVCKELAQYLTSEEVQLARYEAVGWGPSNKKAQGNEAIKNDVALSAIRDQLQYTIPQGQYPGDYWGLATSLGDSVIAGEFKGKSDEDLMKALEDFQNTCLSYVTAK